MWKEHAEHSISSLKASSSFHLETVKPRKEKHPKAEYKFIAKLKPKSGQSKYKASAFSSSSIYLNITKYVKTLFTCMPDVINFNVCQHTRY